MANRSHRKELVVTKRSAKLSIQHWPSSYQAVAKLRRQAANAHLPVVQPLFQTELRQNDNPPPRGQFAKEVVVYRYLEILSKASDGACHAIAKHALAPCGHEGLTECEE